MLNIRNYVNNIYGADDEAIKDEEYVFNKLKEQIADLLKCGYESFAIYPMGNIGQYAYKLLKDLYGIENVICIDDFLCELSNKILSLDDFFKTQKNELLLIVSNNVQIYEDIRKKVKRKFEQSSYIDLFPLKPLYKQDSRIISLELASREIYRYGIKGCVAEVGVYRGYFAEFINHFFPDRDFYLFDTFCGFDARDIVIEKQNNYSDFEAHTDFLDTSVEIVLDKMEYKERCKFIKGYFPDTTKCIEDKEYCFVHLDTDLYLPTLNGLEYFYPRLSRGGYIFIHDFNGLAQGVRNAVKDFSDKYSVGYVCLPDSIIKGSVVITKK